MIGVVGQESLPERIRGVAAAAGFQFVCGGRHERRTRVHGGNLQCLLVRAPGTKRVGWLLLVFVPFSRTQPSVGRQHAEQVTKRRVGTIAQMLFRETRFALRAVVESFPLVARTECVHILLRETRRLRDSSGRHQFGFVTFAGGIDHEHFRSEPDRPGPRAIRACAFEEPLQFLPHLQRIAAGVTRRVCIEDDDVEHASLRVLRRRLRCDP